MGVGLVFRKQDLGFRFTVYGREIGFKARPGGVLSYVGNSACFPARESGRA